MKINSVLFWTATTIIFLWEGLMPALTSHTDMAKEGIRHLGYPHYFGSALVFFKVLGALTLLIPGLPVKLKEWTYAGFTFNFLFASISHWSVDGPGLPALLPLIFLMLLAVSYVSYHKLNQVATGQVA